MADFQLNSNIPLMARTPDLVSDAKRGFALGQQIQQAPVQNQLLQQQQQQNQQVLAANKKLAAKAEHERVLTSIAQGYQELSPFLEGDAIDTVGALSVLEKRRAKIVSQNGDPADTDEAIAALQSGDPAQILRIKKLGQGAVDIAVSANLIEATGKNKNEKFSATTIGLPGGITVQNTTTGRKIVTDAGGNVLKGQEATDAINKAEELKAQRLIDIAGGKREAVLDAEGRLKPNIEKQIKLSKDAAGMSTEIFKRIEGIEQNITNMREGAKLIDQGAATGPIDKWLPSFKASTVKLDNLKNRLGLDVISSVTFGALSAGELKVAFDTAVPENLQPKELKAWFNERIELQEKLLNSLEEAGIFLSEDGATLPKLMAKKRADRKARRPINESPAARTLEMRRGEEGVIQQIPNAASDSLKNLSDDQLFL